MHVFPAIDLRGGQVVRLEQGRAEAETIYGNDPVAVAEKFKAEGAQHLHMVDLDGAFSGRQANLSLVAEVARASSLFVQLGGGFRDARAIAAALDAGVWRVVIGTRACESLEFVRAVVNEFGGLRIAVGIDARDGLVSTHGWTARSEWTAPDLARAVAQQGVRTIVYTDIATDGMFSGPNLKALQELTRAVPDVSLIASGGIATLGHVKSLASLGRRLDGAIIGKALYDGKLNLGDAIFAANPP